MPNQDKISLDALLDEYKAQPVGDGYIDIIVSRENYRPFASALIKNGFIVEAISWWEYLESTNQPSTYGMGGPTSKYYPGWFAETCTDLDTIPVPSDSLSTIIEVVEGKVLGEYDGHLVSFETSHSLTPAFWLNVDENWKNTQ
ncbi:MULTISPECIES: hypothetical protein [unclassified Halomonas]|uniref:hypothetical protein n=1 Tax=unclassified Halomonas TaxID=2609666 RepID=UPI0007D90891|nr:MULTISPECIES: hypothetical protein [unclassified Halomonas]MBT2788255.1 hypothetical protein [Halomonas sp. ISL-106]MBT2796004.1 hypothetical protein [Halomonas sp. ISL-104]OAL61274.1 hypothetical protein A6R74_16970 [Halomonas sp. ALS9]